MPDTREVLWSGWRIANVDTSGHAADVKQSPEYSVASQLRKEIYHAARSSMPSSEHPKETMEERTKKQNILGRGLEKTAQFPVHLMVME